MMRQRSMLCVCIAAILGAANLSGCQHTVPQQDSVLLPNTSIPKENPESLIKNQHNGDKRRAQDVIRIDLAQAIRMAVSYNPLVLRNHAMVDEQVAAIHLRKASYWPVVEANASLSKIEKEAVTGNPFADYLLRAHSTSTALSLTWVLYDAGLRGARLDGAVSLLHAARFSRDAAMRSVIAETITAYYQAEFAIIAAQAFTLLEAAAKFSADSARGRVNSGSGAIADELLAASAYAQARLKSLEAHADANRALSDLAAIIGMSRNAHIDIPHRDEEVLDFKTFSEDVDALVTAAVARHPRVKSALSQLTAARHDVAASRAEGRPVLSLTGSRYRNMTPPQESTMRQKIHGWSAGVQLRIPIFDGFVRQHNIATANARVIARQADVREAAMDVENTIWRAMHDLNLATSRMQIVQDLRKISSKALDVAQGRYQAGVGSMMDVLQAQGDVAEGTRQYVQVGADWYAAKMRLANSIGQSEVGR